MEAVRQINPAALKEAREKAGNGSKSAAAKAAGLSWLGYSLWEKPPGRTKFDHNKFEALCDYLKVTPDQITVMVPRQTPEQSPA